MWNWNKRGKVVERRVQRAQEYKGHKGKMEEKRRSCLGWIGRGEGEGRGPGKSNWQFFCFMGTGEIFYTLP